MSDQSTNSHVINGEKFGNRFVNIQNQKFGRLTADFPCGRRRGQVVWSCHCDCGTENVEVPSNKLRSGRKQSCGCLWREAITTHGCTDSHEYNSWGCMIQRCTNPNNDEYHNYGGRGITVCQRWRDSFEVFLADMGPRPTPKHSIDRFPNANGNYEPGNCRWATQKEQMNNARCTTFLEWQGQRRSLSEWAEITGFSKDAIRSRLRHGWSIERALSTPLASRGSVQD